MRFSIWQTWNTKTRQNSNNAISGRAELFSELITKKHRQLEPWTVFFINSAIQQSRVIWWQTFVYVHLKPFFIVTCPLEWSTSHTQATCSTVNRNDPVSVTWSGPVGACDPDKVSCSADFPVSVRSTTAGRWTLAIPSGLSTTISGSHVADCMDCVKEIGTSSRLDWLMANPKVASCCCCCCWSHSIVCNYTDTRLFSVSKIWSEPVWSHQNDELLALRQTENIIFFIIKKHEHGSHVESIVHINSATLVMFLTVRQNDARTRVFIYFFMNCWTARAQV